jgi:hypothetical protein
MSIAPVGLGSFDDLSGEAGVGVGDCATGGVAWEGHSGASEAHPVDAMAHSDAKVAPFASGPKGPQAAFGNRTSDAKVAPFASGAKAPQATFGHLRIDSTVM